MLLYFTLLLLAGFARVSEQARINGFRFRGDIIAVGLDNHLYMRRSTSVHYPWLQLPNSCCMIQIHLLPNGHILGVGKNKNLYIKKHLNSHWRHIPGSCCVKDVSMYRASHLTKTYDIVGVGMDGMLYSKKSLYSPWKGPHKYSGLVTGVAGVTGRLYGIKSDGYVYYRHSLDDCYGWNHIPGSCCVKSISVQDSGYHLTLGVGIGNKLWKTFLKTGIARWHFQGHHTCCVKAANERPRTVTARLIGVGPRGQLHFKDNVQDPWIALGNIGAVKNIAVLRDGKIVGIGMNGHLFVRSILDLRVWHHVPHSCCVKSIAQFNNGLIVGVGNGHQLWIRNGLYGKWYKRIPNSGSFKSITVDRKNGAIIGVGMNSKLYTRRSLYSGWQGPLRNSCCVKDVKYGSDGRLYGVGTNSWVYRKASRARTSHWQKLGSSCCVKAVEVL